VPYVLCRCTDPATGATGPFYREVVDSELVDSSEDDDTDTPAPESYAPDTNVSSEAGEAASPTFSVMIFTLEVSAPCRWTYSTDPD
jgi:hypothetical protein